PNQTAVNKQISDNRSGTRIVLDVQMKVVADQQRQSAFKATEGKGREKKDHDQQPNSRLAQSVSPLGKVRPRHNVLGTGLAAFRQDEQGQQEVRSTKPRGHPTRTGVSQMFDTYAANGGTENKAQPEGHPNQTHPARPLFRRGDVGDVGLRDGDVAPAKS